MMRFLQSMRGRVFLLLIAGTMASAVFTLLITRHHQAEMIARDRAQRVAVQLAGLVHTLDAASPQERWLILRTVRGLGIQRGTVGQAAPQSGDEILLDALREQLGPNRNLYTGQPEPCREFATPRRLHRREPRCQLVRFTLQDGTPLELVLRAPPPFPMRPLRPVWWGLLLFLACIAVLAWLVARMTTRPLQHLANAADTLDLSSDVALLSEAEGSSEVRSAARAFNRMQQRIKEDLRERTGMLAAITHDLQTPLTRLRLRLEKVQDAELRDKLIHDMNAMQQMLQEGLEFARSRDASEPLQRLDIDSLLASLCADAVDSGQPVQYGEHCAAEVMARPIALRRALTNLVDNAVKYGGNAAVALNCDARNCHIRVTDNGPGIPHDMLETVFTPFCRVEHSRSRETGGSGLGLSIARNIVEQHHGQLLLSNRHGGGLEAHIILPLAAESRH